MKTLYGLWQFSFLLIVKICMYTQGSIDKYFRGGTDLLLTIVQSGFRRLHSTVTSLLHVTDLWLMKIDKDLVTGVVFIDL